MEHDQNQSCKIQFEHIDEKVTSLDGRVDILKGSNERTSQSLIDLLLRTDLHHRRVDKLDTTIISIDKTLGSLMAVTELKEKSAIKFVEQVDSIAESLKAINVMVLAHESYIKDQKESKKDLFGWFVVPVISAGLGWLAGHLK